jgi:hypothetical protein
MNLSGFSLLGINPNIDTQLYFSNDEALADYGISSDFANMHI